MDSTLLRIGTAFLLLPLFLSELRAADSLEATELAELRRYLADLKAGQPCDAARVEKLVGVSFSGLREVMQSYIDLESPIEPHTHRAFHVLLERLSREAVSPWKLVTLYSPEFARFLTGPLADNRLPVQLFERLRDSGGGRQAFDLAVRLTPEASLRYLADGKKPGRPELLAAWNRRLAHSRERRPIPGLARHLETIGHAFDLTLPAEELEAHLRFLASWPALQGDYHEQLQRCLDHEKADIVLAGLAVQQRHPLLLEHNETIAGRFVDQPRVLEAALRNYAFDEKVDQSAVLRRLWAKVPPSQVRARYECLFAMSIHPKGNDGLALETVLESTFDLLDVALLVLKRGDPGKARKAIRHILKESKRGHEEALRLARDLHLKGFEDDAVRIAQDNDRDLVLRQTALLYLQLADGKTRRRLLSLLSHPKTDIRLTAIRMFAAREGLTAGDMNDIGPSLIKVALADPSMGHRQEAIYALGSWRVALAADFFRKVLADNPAVLLRETQFNDERYWQYRFRLMGLLGAAKLNDREARKELLELHRKGGPTERMDVLLAFLDLGEVPDVAFGDLSATEPKLVATAATLIATHGDQEGRERMRRFFRESPLWREFLDSGIDDHNILRIAGLR
jgi:hypothetical protein